MPSWEDPYEEGSVDQKRSVVDTSDAVCIAHVVRLITVYQHLHDALHARSGQAAPMKLVYTRSEQEACLAWVRSHPLFTWRCADILPAHETF